MSCASVALALAFWCIACEDDPQAPEKGGSGLLRITAQPDTSVAYGDTLRLTASAWNPDGDALTYSIAIFASLSEVRSGYVARARMDRHTGEFWFYPGPRDVPSRSMQFGVSDEDGNTDTT